uniref:Odorant receptor n=1 Tax=Leucinodes orbonalis TaxID=711050 RepID=A0AAU0QP17_9NEOP|nr:odorant receptor [Leucinodes orbonalis]
MHINLSMYLHSSREVDVFSLNYMKLVRVLLKTVGAWPEDIMVGRPHRIQIYTVYLIFETSILIVGEFFFILNKFSQVSFFILGDVYIAMTLSFVTVYRAILPTLKRYGLIFKEFTDNVHLIHYKHKNEYSEALAKKIDKLSYYFSLFILGQMVSGVVSFNIPPSYNNYRKGAFRKVRPENITLQFSVHYMFPGFEQENNVIISTLINIFLSYICAFLICTLDLFLCLMVFQIIGHIKILEHSLKNFPTPQGKAERIGLRRESRLGTQTFIEVENAFNDDENETIRERIKACVQHHLFIVNFAENMSHFFGPLLVFNYMYHLISLSLLLMECLQGEPGAYTRYGPLTLMTLTQLMQLSVTFEIVGSESEKLKDEVYYVPWEYMSMSNQKSVGILLQRVQTPIHVTAMGVTDVGVQTMGRILKTTFSYFTLLQSLNV